MQLFSLTSVECTKTYALKMCLTVACVRSSGPAEADGPSRSPPLHSPWAPPAPRASQAATLGATPGATPPPAVPPPSSAPSSLFSVLPSCVVFAVGGKR